MPFFDASEFEKESAAASLETRSSERSKSHHDLRQVVSILERVANLGMWEYDFQTGESRWSERAFELFGLQVNRTVPSMQELARHLHPDDVESYFTVISTAVRQREPYQLRYRVISETGAIRTIEERGEFVTGESGEKELLIGTLQDITSMQLLHSEVDHFATIRDELDVGLWAKDLKTGSVLYYSAAMATISGYAVAAFVDRSVEWADIVHPGDADYFSTEKDIIQEGKPYELVYRIICADGAVKWVRDRIIPTLDQAGAVVRLDGIITDITTIKQEQQRADHAASHDWLTGLPNRRKLHRLVVRKVREKQPFTVVYLNIDEFQSVNETFGHTAGDHLLQAVASRMLKQADEGHILARIGSDEFVWIFSPETDAVRAVEQLFADPFIYNGYEFSITASAGMIRYPDDARHIEGIIHNANLTLQWAKRRGKGTIAFYNDELAQDVNRRKKLERNMKKAIVNRELEVVFQPRVNTQNGVIMSAEALLRWHHPVLGPISPGEFIPIAEENGYINQLGEWVIHEVCRHQKKWREQLGEWLTVSINVSSRQLFVPNVFERIHTLIQVYGVPPENIEFELTEGSFMKNATTATRVIEAFHQAGYRIALDDFGTGYSSLVHIRDFTIDTLKIDRSFITNVTTHKKERAITSGLIDLGEKLNLTIVAEGVETVEQFNWLKEQGCHQIQGYLFSRPLPSAEVTALFRQKKIII